MSRDTRCEVHDLMMGDGKCSCPTVPKRKAHSAAPTLLEGWSVERRSYGVGTCFGGSGDVLCYGKWGVIGGTGSYKILHPTGWIEDRPKFKTELEAMLWVKSQNKPKHSNNRTELRLPGSAATTTPKI